MAVSERSADGDRLLDVRDLRVSFRTDEGLVTAVDGVSFEVKTGQTLGIVVRTHSGDVCDIAGLDPYGSEIRRIRGGEIAMIFQEPMASFSPVYTVGNQLMEAILLHRSVDKQAARSLAIEMLDKVGLSNPALRVDQYPHELSGGMRQRAMIAVALSTNPSLLIADEPTTALDVTIQVQILELMQALQDDIGMSIIFITHNMRVIAQVADEIAVMYLGRVVERGPTKQLIDDPKHPYTQGL